MTTINTQHNSVTRATTNKAASNTHNTLKNQTYKSSAVDTAAFHSQPQSDSQNSSAQLVSSNHSKNTVNFSIIDQTTVNFFLTAQTISSGRNRAIAAIKTFVNIAETTQDPESKILKDAAAETLSQSQKLIDNQKQDSGLHSAHISKSTFVDIKV